MPPSGALVRLIAGDLAGHPGPGDTHTPITYAHATVSPGAQLTVPWNPEFSAFRPITDTPMEGIRATPVLREHRLYQTDFLMRKYGFAGSELALDALERLRRQPREDRNAGERRLGLCDG